ncbi:energy-coupling factor ABC transporter substrate-binding protein [Neobacillus sp. OS1-32]|jgi:cobalt/nickel transport protein|uniref:Cobalt transport protein CbiN n=1 Tax=Neobacillus paridis TaxID=2803862 RepID=A0ABS1TM44_9BACI|nr:MULTISPECIES: energy-coupling factor ABC transporter substrate-binding protein [Neobacillus]MBL4952322.1 energy-coupling factor ABC transporter substrate-binding protein [Neobacillus paridis]WML29141.1 energy-coupling factor ABC transporter substrate-binding protein [Neobacillus sp. OS1-32]
MKNNAFLILVFIFITAIPFFIHGQADFSGTDGRATDIVHSLKPNYKPWVNYLWAPASSEVESFLFAGQAAIGAGAIGFIIGTYRERKIHDKDMK